MGTLKTRIGFLIWDQAASWHGQKRGGVEASEAKCSGDAGEKGLFRRVNRVGRTDMHPHAIEPQAEQPLLLVGAIEILVSENSPAGASANKDGDMIAAPA